MQKKTKLALLFGSIITVILYLGDSLWLYFTDKADPTGWGPIGVVAFSVMIVFPAIAIIGGAIMQLLLKKTWIYPLINAVGVALFILFTMILMKNVKAPILLLIPAVFGLTYAISGITFLISTAVIKKKKAVEVSTQSTEESVSEASKTKE